MYGALKFQILMIDPTENPVLSPRITMNYIQEKKQRIFLIKSLKLLIKELKNLRTMTWINLSKNFQTSKNKFKMKISKKEIKEFQ